MKIEDFRDVILVSTHLSIIELGSSENLIDEKRIRLTKNAAKALIEYSGELIKVDPIRYIARQEAEKDFDQIIEQVKRLAFTEDEELKEQIKNPRFQKSILQFDKILEPGVEFTNQVLPLIRENIKNSIGKNIHRGKNTLHEIKSLVQMMIGRSLKANFDWEDYPWEKIHLFIHTWDMFFKELELSRMKFQKNDWFDLFNIVYVSPNDKYFTLEKKWQRLITSHSITKDYLFKLNPAFPSL